MATPAELDRYDYSSRSVVCKGCTSDCSVNILKFSEGRRFVSGNKCERGAGLPRPKNVPDIYTYKYEKLLSLPSGLPGKRGKVGLPLQLVMYEELQTGTGLSETCGFEVVLAQNNS